MSATVLHTSSHAICLDVITFQYNNYIVTFVYGSNDIIQRRHLWNDSRAFESANGKPWILLEDFNSMLEVKDIIGATTITPAHYFEFRDYAQDCHIFDIVDVFILGETSMRERLKLLQN